MVPGDIILYCYWFQKCNDYKVCCLFCNKYFHSTLQIKGNNKCIPYSKYVKVIKVIRDYDTRLILQKAGLSHPPPHHLPRSLFFSFLSSSSFFFF